MSDESKQHVELALSKVRVIFEEASSRIEGIAPGEKIPATKLAEEIAKAHGMTGPQLYPTLKFLFEGYPGVNVQRGAHGGIIRPKPTDPKAVAATPVAAPAPSPVDTK